MATPYLSVVLIAKDEEANLPRLLDSLEALRPLGYEVCLYDTGSRDGTVRLARSRGVRVSEGRWTGDYAAARNAALAMARGEWALSLDADERIEVDAPALGALLRRRAGRRPVEYAADVHLSARQYTDGTVAHWQAMRLLRVRETYWFRPIHEFPAPWRAGISIKGQPVPAEVLRIVNVGLDDEKRQTASMRRKEEVLEGLLRCETTDGATPDARALTHLDLARSYAITAPDEAERMYRAGHAIEGADEIHPKLTQYYAEFLLEAGRFEEAVPLVEELQGYPELAEFTSWQWARLLRRGGRPEEAFGILTGLGEVRDVQSLAVPPAKLTLEALQAALAARRTDDALVLAVRLVGTHLQPGAVEPLLDLWGTRPPDLLARLLARAAGEDPTAVDEVVTLFGSDERGAAVVRHLTPAAALPM